MIRFDGVDALVDVKLMITLSLTGNVYLQGDMFGFGGAVLTRAVSCRVLRTRAPRHTEDHELARRLMLRRNQACRVLDIGFGIPVQCGRDSSSRCCR
jgi:hypothetical protein